MIFEGANIRRSAREDWDNFLETTPAESADAAEAGSLVADQVSTTEEHDHNIDRLRVIKQLESASNEDEFKEIVARSGIYYLTPEEIEQLWQQYHAGCEHGTDDSPYPEDDIRSDLLN